MTTVPDIWILAEQRHGRLLDIAFELLARGRELADRRRARLTAVLFSAGLPEAELQRLIAGGADRVLAAEAPEFAEFALEGQAATLLELIRAEQPDVLLAGATSTGRTLLPYVAMTAHTGLTADCTGLEIDPASGLLLQTRPAIGGNIMATIACPAHRPQLATVRPKSCRPLPPQPERTGEIVRLPLPAGGGRVRRTGFQPLTDDGGIQEAERLVVVGRGIKKPEHLRLARELAGVLGAALGATRDVVDRGWLEYPHQVGLSGKTVTPKLYVGLGVSGAIQHLAGMQTAGTIVAINSDPEANLFKVADFGLVGDLFTVVPALIRELREGGVPWAK